MQIDTVLPQPIISDAQERAGVPLAGTLTTVTLDPTDPDTDGDGIPDGEEVHIDDFRADQDVGDHNIIAFPGYTWASDPGGLDSDGDGLTDSEETTGGSIATINKSGSAYRWEPNGTKANGSIEWTSDPTDPHSDDDGLDDGTEVRETHTHPGQETTYGITREHQTIVDNFTRSTSHLARGAHIAETSADLDSLELTDATDDFDFVWDDRVEPTGDARVYDRLTFQMIDDTEPDRSVPIAKNDLRSDRWLSNSEEVAFNELNDFVGVPRGPNARLDVWDPDTDDDGLTDGQELYGLTRGEAGFGGQGVLNQDRTVGTSPVMPDSDGDGYWDGWIGVYGVGYSDNVLLYEEHLVSDRNDDGLDGIESGEIVSEQTGIHKVNDSHMTASALMATFNGDEFHSNVHIGELHWNDNDPSQNTDPTDTSSTPSPTLRIEVDAHTSVVNSTILSNLDTAEKNYRLYGMDVEYIRDETLDTIDTNDPSLSDPVSLQTVRPAIASENEDQNHDLPGTAYMFVTSNGGGAGNFFEDFDWTDDPQGSASCQGNDAPCDVYALGKLDFGIVVFRDDIAASSGLFDTLSVKTYVHETGHLLGAGRADDGEKFLILPVEVYSGRIDDDTPEDVGFAGSNPLQWSVMSGGWNAPLNKSPMDGRYIAFSIEELSTIEFNDIDTVG